MKFKWKLNVVTFVLVIVLPVFIISLFVNPAIPKKQDQVQHIVDRQDDVPDEVTIDVLDKSGKTQKLSMNDYLTNVVLCEMPASFEIEALKAQAVVARTYALRRKEKRGKHENADVCMDSNCCQGYTLVSDYLAAGGVESSVDKIRSAVVATQGQVLTYNGALIDATYFSCSGGLTEDAVAVWGSNIPYLRSTESPGEESASHYIDTVQLTADAFCDKLGRKLKGSPGTWVESVSYTAGGGVDVMRLCGVDYKGTELRMLLGLRSTAFVLTAVGDTITITTKGFGHRVGMSQYGADAMAVQGNSYEQILLHYYKGTELVTYHNG